MSSFPHIYNKKKDILVLGNGPTQVLEHTLTAEKMHSINLTVTKTISVVLEFTNLKQKILKLQQVYYVKEIFQKIGQQTYMKRTGFTGYVYGFRVDY